MELWAFLVILWNLPSCLFASSVDWTLIKMWLFFYLSRSARELTAKALLDGPNPLHDYRSSHHQGGVIPPSIHHMMSTLCWCFVPHDWTHWFMKLPQLPWALLVQLHARRPEATHTMSGGDGLIKCTFHAQDRKAYWTRMTCCFSGLCSWQPGWSETEKVPGDGSYDTLQFHCCIIWLCSQSL